jgi:hypothetical protein
MAVPQVIKDRAHKIDPQCWSSYSGWPPHKKRWLERRREAAINAAKLALMEEGWWWDDAGNFNPPGQQP